MAQRDLKLNSLGRYGKDSSRLVLEEHSHCEIPAGCGGVVLRWRNPNSGLLFIVQAFIAVKPQIYIDGATPVTARPLIPFGDHVIALVLADVVAGDGVMAFAAIHDETQSGSPRVSQPSGRRIAILSADDGSWKYSNSEPADDRWLHPGFDDLAWPALVAWPAPVFPEKDMRKYRFSSVMKTGAVYLGAKDVGSRMWIRKTFTLPPTEPATGGR